MPNKCVICRFQNIYAMTTVIYTGTESGHYQGACRPQWFFYIPNLNGTDTNVILRFMRDTVSNVESQVFSPNIPGLPWPGIVVKDQLSTNLILAVFLEHLDRIGGDVRGLKDESTE